MSKYMAKAAVMATAALAGIGCTPGLESATLRGRTLALDDARSPLGARIIEARARAIALVEETCEASLLAHEPHLLRSIHLRNPNIEPIHRAQIELLLRSRRDGRTPHTDRALLATILGIAAGVRGAG